MNRYNLLSLTLAFGAICGCQSNSEEALAGDSQLYSGELVLSVGNSYTPLTSRLAMGGDAMDQVVWEDGDQIFVTAKGLDGALSSFEYEPFNIKYVATNDPVAIFTAQLDPMDEGSYTYYATYPKPSLSQDDMMLFEIASVQNGKYGTTNSIMTTSRTTGSELTSYAQHSMALDFEHHTHMLRIEVPEGRNLMNEGITSLNIAFPREVVGNVVVYSVEDQNYVEYSDSENGGLKYLTIDLEESYNAGGGYIWVPIFPGAMSGRIEFCATGESFRDSYNIGVEVNRDMPAGGITPITLTIPEVCEDKYSFFDLLISQNDLGEEIEKIHLTMSEGYSFDGFISTMSFDVEEDNKITFRMMKEYLEDTSSDRQINVSYESKSALVSGTTIEWSEIVAASIAEDNNLVIECRVPHLFEEDFSSVSANQSAQTGSSIYSIPGLDGWSITRYVQAWQGYAIALQAYYGGAFGTSYTSKATSASMVNIKDDTSVKVKLEFNAEWKQNKYSSMTLTVGLKGSGYTTSDTMTQSESFVIYDNSSITQENICDATARSMELEVSSLDQISWTITCSGASGFSSGTDNIYIDNIKVAIIE